MIKLKLSVLLVASALSIVAIGSAALTNISFDRNISGQVLVDTDENVAIQISNTSKYVGLVKEDSNGKVELNLNEAINNNVSSGFNTDATFAIGSSSEGVIKIKNNSDIPVTISLQDNDAIALLPTSKSSSVIGSGQAGDFYFTINTSGQKNLKELNAILHVEGK
jgi:hypothetical protein